MAGEWWKRAIIYQIYPRSFQDSNGDGIGDLAGLTARLDYLVKLGIDAIWISPIFPSPMADFGYDVADYCNIDPIFGNLKDFDALVAAAHERGLKLILDFVPNHTSDQHPWFVESRSSRTSRKRDWYIWRDPASDGGPPNNWLSNFGGSGWTWDPETGQYYYHAFLKQQPDLNWRNPEVRQAMFDVLRFWMRRGVDGFRVDVLWHLVKDADMKNNPPNPAWTPERPEIERLLQIHSTDQPEVQDLVADMRRVLEEFPDRVLIGEIYLPVDRLVAYYGRNLDGAHLPFNFQLISTAWNARRIASLVAEYESLLPAGGWPNWVLGNHDQHRVATRLGQAQARVAMMLLLTLRGTPTLYQGDELGLEDVEISPGEVQDPWEKNEPGLGFGRDPQRTPMPWDGSPAAGFTTGQPWLPIGTRNVARHVAGQDQDEASLLSLTRSLICLRKRSAALREGDYVEVPTFGDVLAFERRCDAERLLIVLNLGREDADPGLDLPRDARLILSTHSDRLLENAVILRPDEGIIVELPGRR